MDATAIDIRIEVLEVEGIAPGDAPDFRAGVERELARLVREEGIAEKVPSSRSRVVVTAAEGERAAEVAAAVFRALTR